jgi:hypothetical protein
VQIQVSEREVEVTGKVLENAYNIIQDNEQSELAFLFVGQI